MFSTIGYYICIPFAWLVRFFYELTSSYGAAIILFTLVIKLIMLPFQMKSKKSMLRMNRMSGKIQEIQKKYANNQLKMQEEMQKFYQEEGFNPMSGCLWSFLPLPILIALYSIIRQPITHFMMLGEDVLHKLIDAAYNAGINMANIVQLAEDGTMALSSAGLPQLQPYGQINLVNAIQTQLPDAVSGIDGWVNLNYSFLNLNLSTNPWECGEGFLFLLGVHWTDSDSHPGRRLSAADELHLYEAAAPAGRCSRFHQNDDVHHAPFLRVHRLYHAGGPGCLLDCPERVLPGAGDHHE